MEGAGKDFEGANVRIGFGGSGLGRALLVHPAKPARECGCGRLEWPVLDRSAPDGRAAGYADVINRSFVTVSVYGYVRPDYRGIGIGTSLVDWGERWTRDRMPQAQESARVVVQHYVNSANEGARRLLETSGYTPVRGIYVMETTLDEAPPQAHWPAGISVRTFVPDQDERSSRPSRMPSGTCGEGRAARSKGSSG